MVKRIFGIVLLIGVLSGIGFYLFISHTYPNTSTLLTGRYYIESMLHPHAKLNKHVLGFLPYWRLDDMQYIRPQLLSEINYFSLDLDTDGHIKTIENGQTDPGWNAWQRQEVKDFITKAHIMGSEVSITVAALDNETITSILDSQTAQQNAIDDIVKQTKERQLDAINIDFEYVGEPDNGYQEAFSGFSKKLFQTLKKETPQTKLSLSIMPLAARGDGLFEFKKLAPLYDHFIGMSYEYYGQSSDIAGPVAPMKGFKEGEYFFDVTTTYEDYQKFLPKEKIIMGLPYYGWEWAVRDGRVKNSTTFASENPNNYAAVISYARSRESKDIKPNQCQWDTLAQETWCWYTDAKTGVDRQVWPMDNRAINTRLMYAKTQGLAGVAIWTLGYDKQYPDLWSMISKMFTHQ
jgi:spore germination protein YaaH